MLFLQDAVDYFCKRVVAISNRKKFKKSLMGKVKALDNAAKTQFMEMLEAVLKKDMSKKFPADD